MTKKYIIVVVLFNLLSLHGAIFASEINTLKNAEGTKIESANSKNSPVYAPTFSNCPTDITNVTPNAGSCTAVVNWTPPTASGTGPVTITSNYDPGDSFYPGTHRVIYRATDINGTSFCEFTVQVNDNQPPTISVPANITRTADPGLCGAVVNFPYPTATDNCPAGEGAPIDENFDSGTDLTTQCYDFDGTFIGVDGEVNGSFGELETVELINNDIRSFTSPLTRFNGNGEIFFDHKIIAGSPSGNISANARLTVKLITTGGVETIIYTELYLNENVQTEYIPITQSGNFFVQFEWETNQNRSDIAYLDDLYIPGYVVSDTNVVTCGVATHRVVQIAGFPYRSGREFPVGTTTLEYVTRDAAGNIGFNFFTVTVTNNINPPVGNDVNYCEGTPVPTLSVSVGTGETVDWYDAAVGGTLLQGGSASYTPPGPGNYYAETRNTSTGCVSATRRRIQVIEDPQPLAPSAPTPIEYCVNDAATPLMATGEPGTMLDWYDAPMGGTMYPSAPTPDTSTAGTTSYYVEQIDSSTLCISPRTEVIVTVYSLPAAPAVTSPVEYCIGDTAAQIDTHASGTNLKWYDAATGGNEIPGTTVPNTTIQGSQSFWVTQSATSGSTDCESERLQLIINVNTPPSITASPSNQTICPGGNASFTATSSNASTVQWQEFSGGSWNDLSETPPYSNTNTTTLNITGVSLAMNGNRYRLVASSSAATCADATSSDATLTVEDNTNPVVSDCPSGPITANSTAGSCGTPVTWTPPTATDDCGSVTITSNGYNPGDEFLPGTTTIIYTATDAAGNTDTCSFDVIVTDTIDPELTGPTNTTVSANNTGCTAIVNYADPTATDNCVMSTGEYPVATDFEVPSRNDLIAECWIFFGSDVSNSSPLSGSRSFRTAEVEPGQTRGLVSPLMYFNGTGEISFIHRLQAFPNDVTTLTVSIEDEASSITPYFTYTYSDLNLQPANIPITFSGNYRIRFEFDTDTKRNTNKRIRMDNLTIPGIKLSDSANGCARANFNIVRTAGLASGSAFPIGTTTNTFEVSDAYGNTDTYSFDVTVENNTNAPSSDGNQEYCSGEAVPALSATVEVDETVDWYAVATGGIPLSTGSTTFTPGPGTNTYYAEARNTTTDCTSSIRTAITVTENPNPTIAVNSPPSCSADLTTYSLSVTVSDGTLISSEGIVTNTGGNNWTITDVPSGSDITLTTTDSNGCQGTLGITAPNCACPTVNPPTSGGDQAECEQNSIQTLTASATPPAGASVVWYDAPTGGIAIGSPTLNTVGTVTYYAESVDNVNSCTSTTRTPVTLTIQGAPVEPTSGGNQTQCEQSPLQTLTATATAPAGASIVWYDAATAGNIVASPTLNTIGTVVYYAESRDNGTNCPSHSRTAVSLTINTNPAAPISGGDQTECENSPVQTLTATATAPSGASIVWFDTATGGNTVASPTLNSVGTITYYAESQNSSTSCVSDSRTAITLTIQDTPTIAQTPASASCSADLTSYSVSVDVSNGTVTSSAGTVTDNGTGNWTISGIPSGNDITATVTAPNSCSDAISITAPDCSCPVVNAPTSSGDLVECEQNPVQTLTATATPPADATIVWFDSASGGNIVASPTLSAVGTVSYYAESRQNVTNCPSSTRTPVTLTIQATPEAPTSGGNRTECEQNPVQTLTATATAPAGSSVVWYDAASGGNIVANPNLNAVGSTTYYAESEKTTTSCTSFTRTPVTLTIQATPTISISNGPACDLDLLTYEVSVSVSEGAVTSTEGTVVDNGGNNWTISGITSGNDVILTVTAPNSCIGTLAVTAPDCSCPIVDAPTSGGNQVECEQNPIQTLTATAIPPADATVVWYDAASGGNTVASPTLNSIGSVTYFAESRDNITSCTSSTRTAVTLTIQTTPADPVSGGNQNECEASPIQTLTATANPPTGSNIVWYDAATGGSIVASPTLSTVGTITYFAESSDNNTSCRSFNRTPVILTIEDTPDISISNAPTCAADLLTYEVSVNVSEGTVTSTEGTVIDNGGNNWTISGITSGNDITLTVTAANSCLQNLAITAPDCSCPVVNAPLSGGDQTECEQNLIQTLTATATPPADATVVWYDAPSNGNIVTSPILNSVGTITYYAESEQIVTNCLSSTRTPVTLTIQATPTDPISGGDQIECDANPTQTLTATATAPSGASIIWYYAPSGGNIVANPILNMVGSITYYAESRDDNTLCTSFGRFPVQLTINPLPPVAANATATAINAGEPVTLTGSGAASYVWDNGVTDGDTVFPLVTTTYTVIGTDLNGCSNTDSVTIIVGATSDLSLEKTVDVSTPNVGDTVVFTLTATNNGPSDDLGGSIVTDVLPTGYSYVSDTGNTTNGSYDNLSGEWVLPALPNGTSVVLTISAEVNSPNGPASEFNNIAEVTTATNFDSDSTSNNDDGDQSEDDESAVAVTPQVSDLEIANSVSQPTANPGDTLIITVDVLNNGINDATNVSLENIVPTGFSVTNINNGGIQTGNTISWSGLTVPGGLTSSLSFEVVVNTPTGSTNEFLNTVQVTEVDQYDGDSTPNNDDGDQSEDDEDNILLLLQSTDLEVVNTVTPASGNPGDSLTFSIEVINNGLDDATNVDIENYIPSGFTVTNINDNGSQNGNIISWSGLDIANGTTTTLTFEVTINVPTGTPGEYLNMVQVVDVDQLDPDSSPNNDDGDQSEDDEDNAEIVLIPADLSLTKTLSSSSIQSPNAGDVITFELTLTNAGPGIATNVTVVDIIPTGFSVQNIGPNARQVGSQILWDISSIGVGSEIFTYEVSVNVPQNVVDEYTNIAQVIATDQFDPDSAPNNDDGDQSEDDEARHMINAPNVDLAIDKTVDKSETFIDDTLIFTVTVTNNSAYEATNVGIEDVLPEGYALNSHDANLGAYNETTLTWEIPSIPIDGIAILQMAVTVTDVDDYTNVAELIYVDQIDLNIENDRAEATPIVTQSECFTVFNEFTPNDDGLNDVFFIECIDNYPNNNVKVFNRWGNQVFEMNNYDNSWDGTSMGNATINAREKLPVGTYYYLIDFGDGSEPKTGWLYITR